MKLLEYEAKSILAKFDIPTPKSNLIDRSIENLSFPTVLKSQVPVGGRGKAGGIQIVDDLETAKKAIVTLLDLEIRGFKPAKLLAEEVLEIEKEFYLSVLINRDNSSIQLLASSHGGVEVEDQHDFKTWTLDNNAGEQVGQEIADYYELPGKAFVLQDLVQNLYQCFVKNDATLIEINPLVLTKDEELIAGDCKMELDDAASFRHEDWNFEYKPVNANFVTLDQHGTVATIANGAGLAMATVDAVADAGLSPANFLDVGGGANEQSVLLAFQKIVEYPNVTSIVINIFAGITRCDEVAKAIIAASVQIENLPKLYIRLAGTNYEEAEKLLSEASVPLLPTLEVCLKAVKGDRI